MDGLAGGVSGVITAVVIPNELSKRRSIQDIFKEAEGALGSYEPARGVLLCFPDWDDEGSDPQQLRLSCQISGFIRDIATGQKREFNFKSKEEAGQAVQHAKNFLDGWLAAKVELAKQSLDADDMDGLIPG
jgi:hypothetical protein